jgi:NADH dehydrogenase
MKVLVLGGTGFAGRHAAAALRARGHAVVIGTRSPRCALSKLPPALRDCDLRETHLEFLTTCYVWKPLLAGMDAVVNAAGFLRERGGQTYDRVHHMAPAALAVACERLNVRLVHLSLLGLRPGMRSPFLRSRLLGERRVAESFADYRIVRPSLLEGEGGYGAAWLRRIARWPVHPCPAEARGRFAPLDARDLGDALAALCEIEGSALPREIELGGSARRTLPEYLDFLRSLEQERPAIAVTVPAPLARIAATACDLLHLSPLSMGLLELLRRDCLPRENLLQALINRAPAQRRPAYAPTPMPAVMPTGHETPVPPSPQ